MEHTCETGLHLAAVPRPTKECFPEFLRPEVEALARHLWEVRVAHDLPGDPVDDWLDAEEEVLYELFTSPARLLPGGDILHALDGPGFAAT